MTLNVDEELARLRGMTPGELKERYAEVFGEKPRSRNKMWLKKRIAWRLQAMNEGDLSERARRRAAELADDADLRTTAPRSAKTTTVVARKGAAAISDRRLPLPGTTLTRPYKGRAIRVTVRTHGFEYEGEWYPSLSAVAKAVTGKHWNGYHFFGLTGKGGDR